MTSWNENVFCMQTFNVSVMIAITSCWTNIWEANELRFYARWICLINITRPIYVWNSVEIFYLLFTWVQTPYLPMWVVIYTLFLSIWFTISQQWFTYDGLMPTRCLFGCISWCVVYYCLSRLIILELNRADSKHFNIVHVLIQRFANKITRLFP